MFADGTINIRNYVFNFGKYKNKTFEDILSMDAGYILWCNEHIDWFHLSSEDEEMIRNEGIFDNIASDCMYDEGRELWGMFPIDIYDFVD